MAARRSDYCARSSYNLVTTSVTLCVSEREKKTAEQVLADFKTMSPVRDLLTDWILLEAATCSQDEWAEALMQWLERLVELRSRPVEVTQWNDTMFEAHELFAHETFLYIVAALKAPRTLAESQRKVMNEWEYKVGAIFSLILTVRFGTR